MIVALPRNATVSGVAHQRLVALRQLAFETGQQSPRFGVLAGLFRIAGQHVATPSEHDVLDRKVGLVHGASKRWILGHVVFPTVLPDILGGMRVGLGAAWLTIVAAELAGGISLGLGRMMSNYAELVQVPQVIVGMVLIGMLGLLMNEVLLLVEKRLFRWRWQVSL